MRRLAAVPLLALLTATTAAACARSSTPTDGPPRATPLPLLAPVAVPGIPSTTTTLHPRDLAKDATLPHLAATIASFGYDEGRERTFQGESRHLTRVVSRSLVFASARGASRFVSFVRSNATVYFGVAVSVAPLGLASARGWRYEPAACACHLANPDLVAIVATGSRVAWLDVNGPDATPALLETLLRSVLPRGTAGG